MAETPSGSRARRLLTVVAMVALVTFVGRRLARRFRGEGEIEIETESVEPPAEQ